MTHPASKVLNDEALDIALALTGPKSKLTFHEKIGDSVVSTVITVQRVDKVHPKEKTA